MKRLVFIVVACLGQACCMLAHRAPQPPPLDSGAMFPPEAEYGHARQKSLLRNYCTPERSPSFPKLLKLQQTRKKSGGSPTEVSPRKFVFVAQDDDLPEKGEPPSLWLPDPSIPLSSSIESLPPAVPAGDAWRWPPKTTTLNEDVLVVPPPQGHHHHQVAAEKDTSTAQQQQHGRTPVLLRQAPLQMLPCGDLYCFRCRNTIRNTHVC